VSFFSRGLLALVFGFFFFSAISVPWCSENLQPPRDSPQLSLGYFSFLRSRYTLLFLTFRPPFSPFNKFFLLFREKVSSFLFSSSSGLPAAHKSQFSVVCGPPFPCFPFLSPLRRFGLTPSRGFPLHFILALRAGPLYGCCLGPPNLPTLRRGFTFTLCVTSSGPLLPPQIVG